MPLNTSFKTTGVATILYNIDQLRGRQLQSTTAKSLGASAKKVLVPAIQEATPPARGHAGKYPTKGLLSKARQITARRVKTRPGELVAISVKPRQWWYGFVADGTKPHIIAARIGGGHVGAETGIVRTLNRGQGAGYLFFHGIFRTEVHHPGARPNDYVHRAAQGKGPALMAQLGKDLMGKLKEH